MKVIILGSNAIACGIALYLSSNHDVTIIDDNADALKKIGETLDIRPLVGHPAHLDILKQAHADEADLLIAVTEHDEINITACYIGCHILRIPIRIARLRTTSYLACPFPFIDIAINPEQEVSQALKRSTETPGAFDTLSLTHSSIKVLGIRCPQESQLLHTPLKLLGTTLHKANLVVLWIRRQGVGFIPNTEHALKPDDEVYILVMTEDIPFVMSLFNVHCDDNRCTVIVGGGNIGFSFARDTEKWMNHSFLLEKDIERAENVAQLLKNVNVLQGDALDLLNEMDLSDIETVVCVTNDDKVNILSALLSKRQGAKYALALLNQSRYSDFVTSLGIDGIINPQSVTVSTILKHVRKSSVSSLHVLGEIEIIEAEVHESSHVIGLFSEEMNIENGILIAGLIREDRFFALPKNTLIQSGDVLVIAAKKELVSKIEKLFSAQKSFFGED